MKLLKYIETFWIVFMQKINIKKIPIIIISFNQLTYLELLVNFLIKNHYKKIIIIDNNSSYPPLLQYLNTIKTKGVKVIKLNRNYGHTVFWDHKEIFNKYSKGYYVVTDPDIVPLEECPNDFMNVFFRLLKKYKKVTKVGFSLNIESIPNTNKNKDIIIEWEKQFWKVKKDYYYFASLDTTFALYRPNYNKKDDFLDAIRVDYPYQAKHGGWYIDHNNLTEEQTFYMKNATSSSSWRIDKNGDLINKVYENNFRDSKIQ